MKMSPERLHQLAYCKTCADRIEEQATRTLCQKHSDSGNASGTGFSRQIIKGAVDHQWITKNNNIVARGTKLNTSYSRCAPLLFSDIFLYKIIIT